MAGRPKAYDDPILQERVRRLRDKPNFYSIRIIADMLRIPKSSVHRI